MDKSKLNEQKRTVSWNQYISHNIDPTNNKAQYYPGINGFNRTLQSPLKNSSVNSKTIPYPFLSALIERANGTRFTKKVKFDNTDN